MVMRQGQKNNRSRGRGGRRSQNPVNRIFESNGPDVKIRGNASHVAEKYNNLARDALVSGNNVTAENYFQHAEHYQRILAAAQAYNQQQQQQQASNQERPGGSEGNEERQRRDRRPDNRHQGAQAPKAEGSQQPATGHETATGDVRAPSDMHGVAEGAPEVTKTQSEQIDKSAEPAKAASAKNIEKPGKPKADTTQNAETEKSPSAGEGDELAVTA